MKHLLPLILAAAAFSASAQTVTYEIKDNLTGVTVAGSIRHTTQTACDAAIAGYRDGKDYICRRITKSRDPVVVPPVVCAAAPAASVTATSQACPAGQTGGPIVATSTTPYTRGPAPACAAVPGVTTTVTTGACAPIVVPPQPTGVEMWVSTSGNDANPGTQASPKRNFSSLNVNTLAAGTVVKVVGVHPLTRTTQFTNFDRPLVIEGASPDAALRCTGTFENCFETGGWKSSAPWGLVARYTFRNITIDGVNHAIKRGLWLRGATDAIVLDNVTITGFHLGIDCQGGQQVRGLTVRNSRIVRNSSMGVLGACSESLFENNTIAENNFGGSSFDHGMYLSNLLNTVVRGNTFANNSVVNGRCTGGNFTIHGMNDGLVLDGNRFSIPNPTGTCWPISITRGYTSYEGFRNMIVRNNTINTHINGSIVYENAPGILIEGNTVCASSLGITKRADETDLPGGGEVVRNNRLLPTTDPACAR